MANTTDSKNNDSREKGPLHRPAAHIDAGKPNTGDQSSIIDPPSDEHLARPGIDSRIPTGQVSKM